MIKEVKIDFILSRTPCNVLMMFRCLSLAINAKASDFNLKSQLNNLFGCIIVGKYGNVMGFTRLLASLWINASRAE